MIPLIFQRAALLGTLASLVLAILWPHAGPPLVDLLSSCFFVKPIRQFWFSQTATPIPGEDGSREREPINTPAGEHPRLAGGPLKRSAGSSEPLLSVYGHLKSKSTPGHLGHQTFGTPTTASADTDQLSTLPLSLLTGLIVALVIYTLLKQMGAKLGTSHRKNSRKSQVNPGRPETFAQTDLSCRKAEMSRLSREQRLKMLFRHHGGKNLAMAVRFLADELERQKMIILSSLTEEDLSTLSKTSPECSSQTTTTTTNLAH